MTTGQVSHSAIRSYWLARPMPSQCSCRYTELAPVEVKYWDYRAVLSPVKSNVKCANCGREFLQRLYREETP